MTTQPEQDAPNEIVAVAKEAKQREQAALARAGDRMKNWPLGKIGLGVGIGSAAIAGAVLFANRTRERRDD